MWYRGLSGFPLYLSLAMAQVVNQFGCELVSLEAAYGYAYFLLKHSQTLPCRGIPHHGKAEEREKADVLEKEGQDPPCCDGESQSCLPPAWREDPTYSPSALVALSVMAWGMTDFAGLAGDSHHPLSPPGSATERSL